MQPSCSTLSTQPCSSQITFASSLSSRLILFSAASSQFYRTSSSFDCAVNDHSPSILRTTATSNPPSSFSGTLPSSWTMRPRHLAITWTSSCLTTISLEHLRLLRASTLRNLHQISKDGTCRSNLQRLSLTGCLISRNGIAPTPLQFLCSL